MNAEVIEIAQAAVRMYAETHPRPPQVTQAQAAAMLNTGIEHTRFEAVYVVPCVNNGDIQCFCSFSIRKSIRFPDLCGDSIPDPCTNSPQH